MRLDIPFDSQVRAWRSINMSHSLHECGGYHSKAILRAANEREVNANHLRRVPSYSRSFAFIRGSSRHSFIPAVLACLIRRLIRASGCLSQSTNRTRCCPAAPGRIVSRTHRSAAGSFAAGSQKVAGELHLSPLARGRKAAGRPGESGRPTSPGPRALHPLGERRRLLQHERAVEDEQLLQRRGRRIAGRRCASSGRENREPQHGVQLAAFDGRVQRAAIVARDRPDLRSGPPTARSSRPVAASIASRQASTSSRRRLARHNSGCRDRPRTSPRR